MTNNVIEFKQLPAVDDIAGVIEDVFGVKLDISGGWGYDNNSAVIVNSLDIPIDQFLYMFSQMRANIEMNMTLDESNRYGGINTNFVDGQQIEIEDKVYDMITFEITAMKESIYADFIQEYKDNYGKNKDFDMSDHFKRREANTIKLQSDFWFYGLDNYYVEDSVDAN
jgi:hypothetical protein